MNLLKRIRESSLWSWTVAVGAYVLAAGVGLSLRSAAHGTSGSVLIGAFLMSAALIVTALVLKSPSFPRWSLVAASAVLAAGLIVPVLLAPDVRTWSRHPMSTGWYGWAYLLLLGGTPSVGPRWCHSPWTVVVTAVALIAGLAAAKGPR